MVKELAINQGWKRIMIISDSTLERLGYVSKLEEIFKDLKVRVEVYSHVEPEPTFDQVEEIGGLARKLKPDVIIAIGGGSVIDAAKGAWVLLEKEGYDLHSISPFEHLGLGRKCKLLAIPTTSGTGSEASLGIVLSEEVEGRRRKVALGSLEVVPNIVFLDAKLTTTMPSKLTVSTGVDALAHSVEALVSTEASEFTEALALRSIELIFKYLPEALKNPENLTVRSKLHIASFMAGIAFSNSGLGLAHAIAHVLGPITNLPHGTIVGILLPEVVKYNSRLGEVREKYGEVLELLKLKIGVLEDRFENLLLSFYSKIGQPTRISVAGGRVEMVEGMMEEIVDEVYQDPDLAFNPIFPSREDVKKIIVGIL